MTSDGQESRSRSAAAAASDSSHVTRHASPFVWPIRVYWEDTDAGGIVYYANYLRFMERARTEWLRAVGVEQEPLRQQHGVMFVVVDVEAHFRKPARYGELLQVSCQVETASRASLTFVQTIDRDGTAGARILDGRVRVACVDERGRPRPLPGVVTDRIG